MSNEYNEQTQESSVAISTEDRIVAMGSKSLAYRVIMYAYLNQFSPEDPPTPEQAQCDLLKVVREEFRSYNQNAEPGTEWEIPSSLPWFVVADLVFLLCIRTNPGNSILNDSMLQRYIYAYNNSLTSSDVEEAIKRIKSLVTMDSKGRKDGMEERLIDEFKHDLLANASLECIPTTLAYDMYLGWLDEKYKDQKQKQEPCGRNTFLKHLRMLVNPAKDKWCVIDGTKQERVLGRMSYIEPLLAQYHCTEWMKDPDSNNPLDQMTIKEAPEFARGLFKLSSMPKRKNTIRKSKRQ